MKEIVRRVNETRKSINTHASYLAYVNELKTRQSQVTLLNNVIDMANEGLKRIYQKGLGITPVSEANKQPSKTERMQKIVGAAIEFTGAYQSKERYILLARMTGGRKKSFPSSKE